MFSQSLMHSIILALFASSAFVQSAATKTNGTSVPASGPAPKTNGTSVPASGPALSKSPAASSNKSGVAKPKPDSPNSKVICSTGWAPVGDKKPPTTGPKINGEPLNGSKAPQRRATDSTKSPVAHSADDHKSLCDTEKERYTCPTMKCKPSGSGAKKIAEATGCKGKSKNAQCLAYRPGVEGGHISLEAHTPHPTTSGGWIECAAFHKIDPKAGRNQKVDTIACQTLSVPMECGGCEKMNSTKIVKPGQPRTIDPATKPDSKPKSSVGSKNNGTASHPPSSSNATKSEPSGKPKPSGSASASSKTNGTSSAPPSSASKAAKNTQPLGSQPPKAGARQ